ncbi:MAG: hypothetical protein JXA99_15570 [Candidatus Lokiarchaeota archaeon]|nr:hypothetical protein [Candidatus Lokiarchaeota archaeon]
MNKTNLKIQNLEIENTEEFMKIRKSWEYPLKRREFLPKPEKNMMKSYCNERIQGQ